jgi:hypothetical protein
VGVTVSTALIAGYNYNAILTMRFAELMNMKSQTRYKICDIVNARAMGLQYRRNGWMCQRWERFERGKMVETRYRGGLTGNFRLFVFRRMKNNAAVVRVIRPRATLHDRKSLTGFLD